MAATAGTSTPPLHNTDYLVAQSRQARLAWEVRFITDLLRWLRALLWTDEPGTVTFIELALDSEEFAERTQPAAPQATFRGHTLPLQERARVLRLSLCTLQRLVKLGTLHRATLHPPRSSCAQRRWSQWGAWRWRG